MALYDVCSVKWGAHPMSWPTPPRDMPRWWQFGQKRTVRELETVFGPLGQDDLDAYWGEIAKGQSVYEDAGGYIERAYKALGREPTEDPYTYAQAQADLIRDR